MRPYKAVHDVIIRFRERGLPDPLTPAALEQVGVATGHDRTHAAGPAIPRAHRRGGRPPGAVREAQDGDDREYPEQLAEIVRAAYLPVFTIVNPAEDSDTAIADAFRRFEPSAQRDKMIALFRSLCEEARSSPRRRPGSPGSATRGCRCGLPAAEAAGPEASGPRPTRPRKGRRGRRLRLPADLRRDPAAAAERKVDPGAARAVAADADLGGGPPLRGDGRPRRPRDDRSRWWRVTGRRRRPAPLRSPGGSAVVRGGGPRAPSA